MEKQFKEDEEQLINDREKLNKEKEIEGPIFESDVFDLNVGGEILATTRESLTSVPQCLLSILFNGRWERRLHGDQDGNIFFDFNPLLFRHLLDQLQLSDTKSISLPQDPTLVRPFRKMLKKLNLDQIFSSSSTKNVVTVNIDGQIITSQRSNLQLADKNSTFIDYHPKFFRHFVRINRQNKSLKVECQKVLFSKQEKLLPKLLFSNWKNYCLMQGYVPLNAKWNQNAVTVAGGNGRGQQLNQLNFPHGIDIDDDENIVIADFSNHRIVEWRKGAKQGRIIAGGNGLGNRNDQLTNPVDMIIDHCNNQLIIADLDNRRVVRWPRRNGQTGQTIISNIRPTGLAMNNNCDLFVVDEDKHEVRRWKTEDDEGIVVAGGNGQGVRLDQLNRPRFIFVDENESIYVSECGNSRVTKWMKGAKQGVVVAGGEGQGNSLTQLNNPEYVFVDQFETVYVADRLNHQVVRWLKGSKQGELVVGGNGEGGQKNQLLQAMNIVFDKENNLYVTDGMNNRVQKFLIVKSE